ncbi:MAG TPA: ArsI/CadI family heavy metal resistance metalloenzyme [Rudaea sp.]|nr:ArsI/CadI family heavy metal resistance metalloenzyme [Rudaea sp.]
MKRFHVHVSVTDLERSIDFYSTLFGAAPSVRKTDYAKWMLEDPRLNFALSRRNEKTGVNHLGLQVDSADELAAMRGQLAQADAALLEECGAQCCYATSDKYWITDPQGVAWETFHSLGEIPVYGDGSNATETSRTCCAPEAPQAAACCSGGC